MEKIKLKNGQEFELVPMGISINEFKKRSTFKILTNLPYEEIKAAFSDPENISEISHVLDDETINKVYTDCVSLTSLKFEPGDGLDTYTIEFSTDMAERELKTLKELLEETNTAFRAQQIEYDTAIAELTIMLAVVTPEEEETTE